jgi:hypothetical protein
MFGVSFIVRYVLFDWSKVERDEEDNAICFRSISNMAPLTARSDHHRPPKIDKFESFTAGIGSILKRSRPRRVTNTPQTRVSVEF